MTFARAGGTGCHGPSVQALSRGLRRLTPSCRTLRPDACALAQQLVRDALHQLGAPDGDAGVTWEAEVAAGTDEQSPACEALGNGPVVSAQPGEQKVGVGRQRRQPAGDYRVGASPPA